MLNRDGMVVWFCQISSSFIEHFNEQIPQGIPCTEPEPILTDGTISVTYRRMSQESDSSRPPCVDSMASLSSNSTDCPICNESYSSTGEQSVEFLNCDHKECQLRLINMLKRATDSSRVKCLLCHQKTPLLLWETYREIFIILIWDRAVDLDSLEGLRK